MAGILFIGDYDIIFARLKGELVLCKWKTHLKENFIVVCGK